MKFSYKKTIFIGLAFLSISSFWQLYDNIIPLILQNNFNFGETKTGAIMAIDNVLAIFLLPFFGSLSDKINTKIGKRMPFILVGTAISSVMMLLLPYSADTKNLILFLISLAVVLVSMSIYRSPAVALMPDLTEKPLRSKANSVINLMGAVGGIFALLAIRFLVPSSKNPSYFLLFFIIALFMAISVIILFVKVKENKMRIVSREEIEVETKTKLPKRVQKSLNRVLISIFLWFFAYNAVTTAFSRYAVKEWNMIGGGFATALMVAMVSAIISFIPIGIISTKYGRKKTILVGIIILASSYAIAFLFKTYSPIINIVFAMTGIGWASINVNSYPMVVEMTKNSQIGKYTGLYYTFSMSSQIITPVVSGFLLEYISYKILFPYAFIFTVLSFVSMIGVEEFNN